MYASSCLLVTDLIVLSFFFIFFYDAGGDIYTTLIYMRFGPEMRYDPNKRYGSNICFTILIDATTRDRAHKPNTVPQP